MVIIIIIQRRQRKLEANSLPIPLQNLPCHKVYLSHKHECKFVNIRHKKNIRRRVGERHEKSYN
jgi:hypothetical protein